MDATFYQQLCEQEEKLLKRLDALRVLKANFIEENHALTSYKTEKLVSLNDYPTVYDKNLSLKQKIYVALHRIHKGFAEDIAISLNQLDNDITLEKAQKLATNLASWLYRHKVIGKEKFGNKYKYFIKL